MWPYRICGGIPAPIGISVFGLGNGVRVHFPAKHRLFIPIYSTIQAINGPLTSPLISILPGASGLHIHRTLPVLLLLGRISSMQDNSLGISNGTWNVGTASKVSRMDSSDNYHNCWFPRIKIGYITQLPGGPTGLSEYVFIAYTQEGWTSHSPYLSCAGTYLAQPQRRQYF